MKTISKKPSRAEQIKQHQDDMKATMMRAQEIAVEVFGSPLATIGVFDMLLMTLDENEEIDEPLFIANLKASLAWGKSNISLEFGATEALEIYERVYIEEIDEE